MAAYRTTEDMEILESLVDQHDVDGLLEMLALVCYAKAEYVESNWQNKELADEWDYRGLKVQGLAGQLS
jgi:hypothetical protein